MRLPEVIEVPKVASQRGPEPLDLQARQLRAIEKHGSSLQEHVDERAVQVVRLETDAEEYFHHESLSL